MTQPRAIAIAVLRRADGAVLVTSAVDPDTGRTLVRPPGGGIDPGETATDAVARELQEELALLVTDAREVAVLEHRLSFAGRERWERVHVCTATIDAQAELPATTDAGHPVWWLPRDRWRNPEFDLVPEGLLELLERD